MGVLGGGVSESSGGSLSVKRMYIRAARKTPIAARNRDMFSIPISGTTLPLLLQYSHPIIVFSCISLNGGKFAPRTTVYRKNN